MTQSAASPASPAERIFVALDTTEVAEARRLVETLAGRVGGFKLGKEFFTARGPEGVRQAVGDRPLFLDLKLHDIPNTVAGAMRAATALRPRFITLHASGGSAMMRAAREAADEAAAALGIARPALLAVTVLTSLDEADLTAVGQYGPMGEQVLRLAALAREAGLDGVVCSPREIGPLRAALGPDLLLVVPGIRPAWAAPGDQKRVMAPGEAIAAGADYLVIGRPITAAAQPAQAAERIAAEIAGTPGGARP